MKLVDDIAPCQLDLLVKALIPSALDQDFKKLLTPKNIREVTDNIEEFVP